MRKCLRRHSCMSSTFLLDVHISYNQEPKIRTNFNIPCKHFSKRITLTFLRFSLFSIILYFLLITRIGFCEWSPPGADEGPRYCLPHAVVALVVGDRHLFYQVWCLEAMLYLLATVSFGDVGLYHSSGIGQHYTISLLTFFYCNASYYTCPFSYLLPLSIYISSGKFVI